MSDIVPIRREYYQREIVDKETRDRVFRIYGQRCYYCSATEEDGVEIQVDHVTAVARGGSNDFSNLLPACKPCNLAKGAKSLDEWLEKQVAERDEHASRYHTLDRRIRTIEATVKTVLK
jgi:5-methylcytosine-specific restriction endonuclease McrA